MLCLRTQGDRGGGPELGLWSATSVLCGWRSNVPAGDELSLERRMRGFGPSGWVSPGPPCLHLLAGRELSPNPEWAEQPVGFRKAIRRRSAVVGWRGDVAGAGEPQAVPTGGLSVHAGLAGGSRSCWRAAACPTEASPGCAHSASCVFLSLIKSHGDLAGASASNVTWGPTPDPGAPSKTLSCTISPDSLPFPVLISIEETCLPGTSVPPRGRTRPRAEAEAHPASRWAAEAGGGEAWPPASCTPRGEPPGAGLQGLNL